MSNYKWDAQDYAQNNEGQAKWAQGLMGKLALKGDERLLDVGCGDGKITAQLAANLPKGKAIGVDSSVSMIRLASQSFSQSRHLNLSFLLADFRWLPFRDEFDIVFSNAALHWVQSQKTVLKSIHTALRPGGRLLAQLGGRGNAAKVLDALDEIIREPEWRDYFVDFKFPYGFYSDEEYERWLLETGFMPKRVELIPKVMVFESPERFMGWLRTVWLPYTERIPKTARDKFVRMMLDTYLERNPAESDGTIYLDMVRLEVEAVKQ